jgi:hypothetical protein
MTTYTVPSGTNVYSQTLTADTADTVTFGVRANYVSVTNIGTTVLYARADGQDATVAGEGCIAVLPGQEAVLANGAPIWHQSARVLLQGDDNANGESKGGQAADPGTTVSVISSAAVAYAIGLAG